MLKTQVVRGDKFHREVWEFRLYFDFVRCYIFLDSYRKESKTEKQRKWRRDRNGSSVKHPPVPPDVEKEMRDSFCKQILAVLLVVE